MARHKWKWEENGNAKCVKCGADFIRRRRAGYKYVYNEIFRSPDGRETTLTGANMPMCKG